MFDKRTLLIAALSFATVFGMQMFFRDSFDSSKTHSAPLAGSSYKIPTTQDLSLPAEKTISFSAASSVENETVVVSTSRYNATFNTVGGTLDTLSYPEHCDVNGAPLQAIHHAENPAHASFIIGLNEEAPLAYRYESQRTLENGDVAVCFSARIDEWSIKKTFILHHDTYVIDLLLEFQSRVSRPAALRPRVFIAAPHLKTVARDVQNGVYFDVRKSTLYQATDAQRSSDAWVTPPMIGVENSYFAHVLIADKDGFAQRGYFTSTESSWVSAIVEGPALTDSAQFSLSYYVGPKSLPALSAVDSRLEGLLHFGWLSWFAKMIVQLLAWLYQYVFNYGLAIIVLTVLLKLVLLPFSIKSARYMEMQQRLQPYVAGLRKKYAHDTALFNTELVRLYQQHNVSPATFLLGCLLMIPQWPIFFAMYRVLSNVIELHQAPFFLWITDLSVKDPYYILPAFVVVLTFLQPFGGPQADSRTKMMGYIMPLILSAVFVNMPAGLLLFVMTNFVVTLLEQKARKLFIK
jgi:YidC/Oxa1 family membrane protein insertase